MAVCIRLKRFGAQKKAQWRVVVADKKMPRDGRFIEEVGFYDPRKTPARIQLKMDRIQNWVSKGAQLTDTVKSLVKKSAKAA